MIRSEFNQFTRVTVRYWTCDSDGCRSFQHQTVPFHECYGMQDFTPLPGWAMGPAHRTLCPACATIERLAAALLP